jgi:flagellar protein FlaG
MEMSTKVSLTNPAADPLAAVAPRRVEGEIQPVKAAEPAPVAEHADLRLIIEESGDPGHYVYTIVDRRSGRIVSQLPRDDVLKLGEQKTYEAGALFKGEA